MRSLPRWIGRTASAAALLAIPAAAQETPLLPAAQYTAGTGPAALAVNDLDGDGRLDLVAANEGGNKVSAFLGNGSGGLSSQIQSFVGPNPSSVAVGQLDGDGVPDLVASLPAEDIVTVSFGDGSGGFGAPVNFPGGDRPEWVELADLNGNGANDMVVAARKDDALRVYFGDGLGGSWRRRCCPGTRAPVSYTHLTLPTIYSV